MPEHQQQILAASKEFFSLILAKLKDESGVHAETAIASASRMAGTFLLRTFGLPLETLEPGTALFSEQANEKGSALVALLSSVLEQLKVPTGSDPTATGQGAVPQLSVIETQARMEPALTEIMTRHQLTYDEAAQAAAIAAGLFIQQCWSVLEPQVGFNVAAYGFVEGSKTVPAKLQPPLQ
jgi:hypothetical protein